MVVFLSVVTFYGWGIADELELHGSKKGKLRRCDCTNYEGDSFVHRVIYRLNVAKLVDGWTVDCSLLIGKIRVGKVILPVIQNIFLFILVFYRMLGLETKVANNTYENQDIAKRT